MCDHIVFQLYSQATAFVCYKVWKVGQGKAVSKVKKCHDVWSQNSDLCKDEEKNNIYFTKSKLPI